MTEEEQLCEAPLISQVDLFTSEQRTPWGGRRIIERYKRHFGLSHTDFVGESWELSSHSDGSSQVESPLLAGRFSLRELARKYPHALMGSGHQSMPFLLKLINSGSWAPYMHLRQPDENYHQLQSRMRHQYPELHGDMVQRNLSIQVHPNTGDVSNCPSKNEAWIILEAEEGAGLYLGLQPHISPAQFERAMRSGDDCSQLMVFVPVQAGQVYHIPAGTLHAIGAGILLLEAQENSAVTFRAYDWGRSRPLHFEETLRCIRFDGPTGSALRCGGQLVSERPRIVEWVSTPWFVLSQIQLAPGEQLEVVSGSLQGYFVDSGELLLEYGENECKVPYGRSFVLPAASPQCRMRPLHNQGVTLYSVTGSVSDVTSI
jgi:mannose-6-phosphate isomerase class I